VTAFHSLLLSAKDGAGHQCVGDLRGSVAFGSVISAPLYVLIGFQPLLYGGWSLLLVSLLVCLLPPSPLDLAAIVYKQPALLDSLALPTSCPGVMEACVGVSMERL